jgi:hypoxanthine phosphoribosyltransferase
MTKLTVYNQYSDVMFSPDRLRSVVAELAAHLPHLREEFNFDTIVVSGKSGAAVGFALSMVTDINVVFVRKGESTHGDMIEGPSGHKFTRYAFFDDFVASGATRDRVHSELQKYAENRSADAPERVLTIEYQKYNDRVSHLTASKYDKRFQVAAPYELPARQISIH